MKIGIDGRKIPDSAERGPIRSLDHGKELGMAGLFFRTVLDMSPTLDHGELRAIRAHADSLGMYVEAGLAKVNPFALPEAPEVRHAGDGDTLLGFRRMMEACATIECRELWVATANHKGMYSGRFAYDRFRTDVSWADQLEATRRFLHKLAPIARDLRIHLNMETHEEITTFELVRLIEDVGADVLGITYDLGNPIQRLEHPLWAAKRIAPYVRQTHIKDIYIEEVDGGYTYQSRACGTGVIPFHEILPLLATHNPSLNLSIENNEPRVNPVAKPRRMIIAMSDPVFLEGHPDLTVGELAAYVDMIQQYRRRCEREAIPDWDTYSAAPFGYVQAVDAIKQSAGYLRQVCREQNLPLEAPQ